MSNTISSKTLEIIKAEQVRLSQHPIFSEIQTLRQLQMFCETHVYAVWDFMCLLKYIQQAFTCTSVPWIPPESTVAARLINDIVLGEESDVLKDGTPMSHYEMYLAAMKEVGASTHSIERAVSLLKIGCPPRGAVVTAKAPTEARWFVESTFDIIDADVPLDVVAWFLFGRESAIPLMFQSLLDKWGFNQETAPMMTYYLERHIEVDGNQHQHGAHSLLEFALEREGKTLDDILHVCIASIAARYKMWDGLRERIHSA